MARGKRTIRASEIGTFIFCQRAWWYQRKNLKPSNQEEITNGSDFHSSHWLKTQSVSPIRTAAWILLFFAILFLALYFINPFNL